MATRLLKKSIDQIPNPTHRSLIETCVKDVDRLRDLIDELLSVSRFDVLTQRLNLKEVDLKKLLKQSVQSFQPEAFERGIDLVMGQDLVSGSSACPGEMDAPKISWAIGNLLTNALRHSPRGARVEIDLSTEDDAYQVSIRDHGTGIERTRQEKIFDKFSQRYDLRVGRTGGAGMGLAIAREIVIAHGGRIWVSSEPGKGSVFSFTVPFRRRGGSSSSVPDLGGGKGVS